MQRLREKVKKYLEWDEVLNAYQLSALFNEREYFVSCYYENNNVGIIAFYKLANALTFRGSYKALLKILPMLRNHKGFSCYAILTQDLNLVRKHLSITRVIYEILMVLTENNFKSVIKHDVKVLNLDNYDEIRRYYFSAFSSINELEYLLSTNRVYASLTQEGEVASIAYIQDVTNKVAMIGGVYTRDDLRRRGYARSCLSYMINKLFHRFKYVGLLVEEDNYKAINLYKSLGFKPYSRLVYFEIK